MHYIIEGFYQQNVKSTSTSPHAHVQAYKHKNHTHGSVYTCTLLSCSSAVPEIISSLIFRLSPLGRVTSGLPILSSREELSPSLLFPNKSPSLLTVGSSNKSSKEPPPTRVWFILVSMATDFGTPVESGSSPLDDESESGKSLLGSLFSTFVRFLVFVTGTVLLPPKGADFIGTLVSTEAEVLLDGLVVLLACDGEDFPEGTLGGRTMTSLVLSSESSSLLLLLLDDFSIAE